MGDINNGIDLQNDQLGPKLDVMSSLTDLSDVEAATVADGTSGNIDQSGLPETVLALQPISIVDHVSRVTPEELKALNVGEPGGSRPTNLDEIRRIITTIGEFHSNAGGSASNTLRGLAGFGIGTKLVGARGFDEWGALFVSSMKRAGVNTERVEAKEGGATGRCCILSCQGQRTMRTCLDGAARLQPEEMLESDFQGTQWAFLSGYCLYTENLLSEAIKLAVAAGTKIALDLGSFEIVRNFRPQLQALLESGHITVCFCNEDEATEVSKTEATDTTATPSSGLDYIAKYCDIAIVTLGEKGCMVKERTTGQIIHQAAVPVMEVVDTTGAGDIFAAGFLYGLIRKMGLVRAAEIGCLAGAAVIQTLGSEMTAQTWHWLHSHMHGPLAGDVVRSSALEVQKELLACYALIAQLGRGPVYYGSARLREGTLHWTRAEELGKDVALLLGTTSWSGGGPGLMQAAMQGAMQAGAKVGGIRIAREAGTKVLSASYLPESAYVMCRFLSSRKVALVDSGMRNAENDKTAFVFFPGGLGTCDEFFEILTLVQLRKLGTKYPVPILAVNYDGFFNGLLDFLAECDANGTIGAPELEGILVVQDNEAALQALADFYKLERPNAVRDERPGAVLKASEWAAYRQNRK